LNLLVQLNPTQAFDEVIGKSEYVSEKEIEGLRKTISRVSRDLLLKGLENQWENIRRLAVSELARRGELTKHLASGLGKDSSAEIRQIAFEQLAGQGEYIDFEEAQRALSMEGSTSEGAESHAFTLLFGSQREAKFDVDLVFLAFFNSQSIEKVLEAVDWYSVKGPIAYKCLAINHYEVIASQIRSDLDEGFRKLKDQSGERLRKHFGENSEKLIKSFEGVDDFIRSQFIEAGLLGLAQHGQPSDVGFARQHLLAKYSSVKSAALNLIVRFGDADDVPALIKIARESWGGEKQIAAAAALRLAARPFDFACELTTSGNNELAQMGLTWLFAQNSEEVKVFFKGLLEGDEAENRARAVLFFSRRMTPEEMEQFLGKYHNRGAYYYNVVDWLDRLLYSPPLLRAMFIRKLEESSMGSD